MINWNEITKSDTGEKIKDLPVTLGPFNVIVKENMAISVSMPTLASIVGQKFFVKLKDKQDSKNDLVVGNFTVTGIEKFDGEDGVSPTYINGLMSEIDCSRGEILRKHIAIEGTRFFSPLVDYKIMHISDASHRERARQKRHADKGMPYHRIILIRKIKGVLISDGTVTPWQDPKFKGKEDGLE